MEALLQFALVMLVILGVGTLLGLALVLALIPARPSIADEDDHTDRW